MIKREHHIVNRPPQDDTDLIMAIGRMTVAFGRLEDVIKILQARVDEIDPDEFILNCGQDKKTAHKMLKNIGRYYDAAVMDQVKSLFKSRNDFLHSTYTSDEDGQYVRVREGDASRDIHHDIKTMVDMTEQACAIVPQLAELQPNRATSLKNVTIRPADFSTDRPVIAALMDVLQNHEKTVRPQRDTWSHIEDNYLAHLEECLTEKQGLCLLAEYKEAPVGMICGWIEQPDVPAMDNPEPPYGYISEGIVQPALQRQGIYQKLVDEIEAYFKEQGVTMLRTNALHGNENIVAFLNKNGFTPYYTCFEKNLEKK